MSSLAESVKAITESRPPATDAITYLTIIESHLSIEVLPHLNELLQDTELTQDIGWDLISHLIVFGNAAEECLTTVARLGNPREVILKITETLQELSNHESESESEEEEEEEEEEEDEGADKQQEAEGEQGAKENQVAKDEVAETAELLESTKLNGENKSRGAQKTEKDPYMERFCLLLKLLAIVHPRIKTKYPSRFLATSLNAILSAYRPYDETTLSAVMFVHAISEKKRPQLPGRKSSIAIQPSLATPDGKSSAEPAAPDPEAEAEDPEESQIQKRYLQMFLTHVLQRYCEGNDLDWAARIQERYQPTKTIPGRKTLGESYREDPKLQQRDTTIGQLVALTRDLEFTDIDTIMDVIHAAKADMAVPGDSTDEIDFSKEGCLYLLTCFVFSSEYFENSAPIPDISIFPDHMKLIRLFIGVEGMERIGSESPSVIDALLFLGIWLEHNNKFVSGPLADEDFLLHLQFLTIISASSPSAKLRYQSHLLASSILHAHPVDRMRLTFITDTLEHCPFYQVKALAVGWLRDEIIAAKQRKVSNAFSKTVALASVQPYLFPDLTALPSAELEEVAAVLDGAWDYHMTVLNFLLFLHLGSFDHLIPTGMNSVVEMIYVAPLKELQQKLEQSFVQVDKQSELDGVVDDEETKEFREMLSLLGGIVDSVIEQQ